MRLLGAALCSGKARLGRQWLVCVIHNSADCRTTDHLYQGTPKFGAKIGKRLCFCYMQSVTHVYLNSVLLSCTVGFLFLTLPYVDVGSFHGLHILLATNKVLIHNGHCGQCIGVYKSEGPRKCVLVQHIQSPRYKAQRHRAMFAMNMFTCVFRRTRHGGSTKDN